MTKHSDVGANLAVRARTEQRRAGLRPNPVEVHCRGGTMLVDIGCGSGAFLRQVRHRYHRVVGIDFIPLARPAFENTHVLRADLRLGIPLADAVADTVTAIELVEHIADPVFLVREAFRIARPGGELVLTTPNTRYVRHLLRLVVEGHGPKTSGYDDNDVLWDGGHIHYFTRKDLEALLTGAGFVSIRSIALIQPNGFMPGMRRLLSRWPESPLVREFLTGRLLVTAKRPEDR